MRYRHTSGFGPLKRTRWEDRPFELRMAPGQTATPLPELILECVEHPHGIALQGSLRGRQCFFADLSPTTGKTFTNFVMVSVANLELRGRVQIAE